MLHRPFNAKVSPWDSGPAHALSNTRSRCNGVRPLQSFAGDQGLPATRSSTSPEREDRYFRRGGCRGVDALTFRCDGCERVRLNGEVLHRDDWSYASLRVCPTCLGASGASRQDCRLS